MSGANANADGGAVPTRDAIFDAALDEFRTRGIDQFSLDGVAQRANVDPGIIVQTWGDWRVLLMDAQISRAREQVPTPDTGSLQDDLRDLGASLSDLSVSAQGRQLFHRKLPTGRDADLSEVRSDFWTLRFEELETIVQRAAERGEVRDGVDCNDAIQMFSAAYFFDVIFFSTPVRPNYAQQVIDIFLNGITQS